ncbi:hypothetical protein GCM10022251_74380 [Phytohabitans flavus]|uniref:Uncharacterized protein n=1 Tax=Phytohabitans flavus TaxID=1076124 RepID=A0A6F8XL23_9ACTN|nr:hypothetical protein Pflav_009260 [Phytohabitans flavus]
MDLPVKIRTNATVTSDVQSTALAELGNVRVNVSFDGFRPSSHGRFRTGSPMPMSRNWRTPASTRNRTTRARNSRLGERVWFTGKGGQCGGDLVDGGPDVGGGGGGGSGVGATVTVAGLG